MTALRLMRGASDRRRGPSAASAAVEGPRATGASAWFVALAMVAGLASPASGLAPTAEGESSDLMPVAAATASVERTRTLTREFLEPNGMTTIVDTRTVSMSVETTTALRDRERIRISWTGAHPTGGRSLDPYGYGGLGQEYPVVILLCRGVEGAVSAQDRVTPETCWTTSRSERDGTQLAKDAVWAHDLYADPATVAVGGSADPWPAACDADSALYRNFLVPFRAADGTVYWECTPSGTDPATGRAYVTTAPEQVPSRLLANDVFAPTALDGTGSVEFEVRTTEANESLGCSDEVACSVVVIPIMGISCADRDPECRRTGTWSPGTLRGAGSSVDLAVAGDLWWSPSNWRNRFTVALDIASAPDVCDRDRDRDPVTVFGSELLNQASLQWAPGFCLSQGTFTLRHYRSTEDLARRMLETGDGDAAFVSVGDPGSSVALAYAPTAVTGFGIGFVADLADGGGEVTQLRLTPRLVAKLLTESYPATSAIRSGHRDAGGAVDLAGNPLTITADPEFIALNPGVPDRHQVSESVLVALSGGSDVITAVTSWIAADPAAMAFVAGQADEHGMRVNGYYRGLQLPVAAWPLLDGWVETSTQTCLAQLAGSTPTLARFASPVATMGRAVGALLDQRPTSHVVASVAGNGACAWESERQITGTRFMLGLVPVADANRYGIRLAALSVASEAGAPFQRPTDEAMAAALRAFHEPTVRSVATADYSAMPADAYPGTMVVSTAVPLDGLSSTQVDGVASALRYITGSGQVPGRADGQLPAGYLPIRPTGVGAGLYRAAQAALASIDPPPSPGGGDVVDLDLSVPAGADPGTLTLAWPVTGPVLLAGARASTGDVHATAALVGIEVRDTRRDDLLTTWQVNAQSSSFVGAEGEVDASGLGWTPAVPTLQLAAGSALQARAGPPVASRWSDAGSLGLSSSALLGRAVSPGRGTAALSADLVLDAPASVAPGAYTATLTITLVAS